MNRNTFFPRFLSGYIELPNVWLISPIVSGSFVPWNMGTIDIGSPEKQFKNIYSNGSVFNQHGELGINNVQVAQPLTIDSTEPWNPSIQLSIDETLQIVNGQLSIVPKILTNADVDLRSAAPIKMVYDDVENPDDPIGAVIKLEYDDDDFYIDEDGEKLKTKEMYLFGKGGVSISGVEGEEVIEFIDELDEAISIPKIKVIKIETDTTLTQTLNKLKVRLGNTLKDDLDGVDVKLSEKKTIIYEATTGGLTVNLDESGALRNEIGLGLDVKTDNITVGKGVGGNLRCLLKGDVDGDITVTPAGLIVSNVSYVAPLIKTGPVVRLNFIAESPDLTFIPATGILTCNISAGLNLQKIGPVISLDPVFTSRVTKLETEAIELRAEDTAIKQKNLDQDTRLFDLESVTYSLPLKKVAKVISFAPVTTGAITYVPATGTFSDALTVSSPIVRTANNLTFSPTATGLIKYTAGTFSDLLTVSSPLVRTGTNLTFSPTATGLIKYTAGTFSDVLTVSGVGLSRVGNNISMTLVAGNDLSLVGNTFNCTISVGRGLVKAGSVISLSAAMADRVDEIDDIQNRLDDVAEIADVGKNIGQNALDKINNLDLPDYPSVPGVPKENFFSSLGKGLGNLASGIASIFGGIAGGMGAGALAGGLVTAGQAGASTLINSGIAGALGLGAGVVGGLIGGAVGSQTGKGSGMGTNGLVYGDLAESTWGFVLTNGYDYSETLYPNRNTAVACIAPLLGTTNPTVDSISNTTGMLVVAGGIGCLGDIFSKDGKVANQSWVSTNYTTLDSYNNQVSTLNTLIAMKASITDLSTVSTNLSNLTTIVGTKASSAELGTIQTTLTNAINLKSNIIDVNNSIASLTTLANSKENPIVFDANFVRNVNNVSLNPLVTIDSLNVGGGSMEAKKVYIDYNVPAGSTITSSSQNSASYPPWNLFDVDTESAASRWLSAGNRYVTATGVPSTNPPSTTVDGVAQTGEWIQMEFPAAVLLTSLRMKSGSDYTTRSPRRFIFVGMREDGTWQTIIDNNNSDVPSWSVSETKTFEFLTNTLRSNTYRLIITRIGLNANAGTAQLLQMYFGTYERKVYYNQSEVVNKLSLEETNYNKIQTDTLISSVNLSFGPNFVKAGTNVTLNSAVSVSTVQLDDALINGTDPWTTPTDFPSGMTYTVGDAVYNLNASSYNYNAYLAFQSSPNEGYASIFGKYSTTTFLAASDAGLTVIDGVNTRGEWISIAWTNPKTFYVNSFDIGSTTTYTLRNPVQFILVGSNDGVTWQKVYSNVDDLVWASNTEVKTFTLGAPVSYSYYRLVVTKIAGNAGRTNVGLWKLKGFTKKTTSLNSILDIKADKSSLASYYTRVETDGLITPLATKTYSDATFQKKITVSAPLVLSTSDQLSISLPTYTVPSDLTPYLLSSTAASIYATITSVALKADTTALAAYQKRLSVSAPLSLSTSDQLSINLGSYQPLITTSTAMSLGSMVSNITTDASSISTGSVQIKGGLGVAKNVYANNMFIGTLPVATQSYVTGLGYQTSSLVNNAINTALVPYSTTTQMQTYVNSQGFITASSIPSLSTYALTSYVDTGLATKLDVDYFEEFKETNEEQLYLKQDALAVSDPMTLVEGALSINLSTYAQKTEIPSLTGYVNTAGTGLTKSGSTLSVNSTQSGITSVGTLTGLSVSGTSTVAISNSSSSTSQNLITLLQGSLPTGSYNALRLGRATSNFNHAVISFNYTAANSTSNRCEFGLGGAPHLIIDGNGLVSVDTLNVGGQVVATQPWVNTQISSLPTNTAISNLQTQINVKQDFLPFLSYSWDNGGSYTFTPSVFNLNSSSIQFRNYNSDIANFYKFSWNAGDNATLRLGKDYDNSGVVSYMDGGTMNFGLQGGPKVSLTSSTLTIPHAVNITNTTFATSYTSGALVVNGGVGIKDRLYVNGSIFQGSYQVATLNDLANKQSLLTSSTDITVNRLTANGNVIDYPNITGASNSLKVGNLQFYSSHTSGMALIQSGSSRTTNSWTDIGFCKYGSATPSVVIRASNNMTLTGFPAIHNNENTYNAVTANNQTLVVDGGIESKQLFITGTFAAFNTYSGNGQTWTYTGNSSDVATGSSAPVGLFCKSRIAGCGVMTVSDVRTKKNIETLPPCSEVLKKIRPVQYTSKIDESFNMGVIADEVEHLFPCVTKDPTGMKHMDYQQLNMIAIKALQETMNELAELRDEHSSLKQIVAQLQNI
jgi:Chaperone of endosialidase